MMHTFFFNVCSVVKKATVMFCTYGSTVDMERRDLSHKEKLYLREQNVITETQCTLGKKYSSDKLGTEKVELMRKCWKLFVLVFSGLTALRSDEVIDLMIKEYPPKHAEYSVILQERERQRIDKEYSVSIKKKEYFFLFKDYFAFLWSHPNIWPSQCVMLSFTANAAAEPTESGAEQGSRVYQEGSEKGCRVQQQLQQGAHGRKEGLLWPSDTCESNIDWNGSSSAEIGSPFYLSFPFFSVDNPSSPEQIQGAGPWVDQDGALPSCAHTWTVPRILQEVH